MSQSTFELLLENQIPHFAKEINRTLKSTTTSQTTKKEQVGKEDIRVCTSMAFPHLAKCNTASTYKKALASLSVCKILKLFSEWTVMGPSLANDLFFNLSA